MPVDILIYALVAAGLVFWLRSLLGTRSDDDRQRPNPFAGSGTGVPGRKTPVQSSPGLLPGSRRMAAAEGAESETLTAALDRHVSLAAGSAESGLLEISRADRSFSLARFVTGAQDAFVMIVEAFARGDRETLENLLSPAVFKIFSEALKEQEARGEKTSVEIHSIRKIEIADAKLVGRQAYITVRFTADETRVTRTADDKVVFGNPDKVSETVDIWTFGRDVRSRSPVWLVYETRDEDSQNTEYKTTPDARP